MAKLFLDNRFSDVTIYVGSNKQNSWKFPVHQMVLSGSSPVFAAMFSGKYNESQDKEVIIDDICPQTFYKLLFFLYKDELNISLVSEGIDILQAADKYEIKTLISVCLEKLFKLEITLDNFWDFFTNYISYGDQLTSMEMRIKLFVFLDKNASSIVKHEKFALITSEFIFKIASRDTLQIKEIDLCDALVKWAKMQCCAKQISITAENEREMLENTFYQIRFLTIDKNQLQTSAIYDFLTAEEKESLMDNSNIFPEPWDEFLMSKKREKFWFYKQPMPSQKSLSTETYFVFAKDTFVHFMEIQLCWEKNKKIRPTQVTVSAMTSTGLQLPVKTEYYREVTKSTLRISSVYAKAFTVYALQVEPNDAIACFTYEFDPWGYEYNLPVFYNVSITDINDFLTFCSIDYWKYVFGRNPEVLDDDVVNSEIGTSSCISKLQATFC